MEGIDRGAESSSAFCFVAASALQNVVKSQVPPRSSLRPVSMVTQSRGNASEKCIAHTVSK